MRLFVFVFFFCLVLTLCTILWEKNSMHVHIFSHFFMVQLLSCVFQYALFGPWVVLAKVCVTAKREYISVIVTHFVCVLPIQMMDWSESRTNLHTESKYEMQIKSRTKGK